MNPKTSLLALIALASSTVFAAGPAAAGSVQQRHHNGVKAHHNPIHRHNHKRGAMGKAAYCAAKTASIASVSAASTASVASVSTASEASVAAQSTKSVASVSSESKASTRYAATHTTAQPKPTPKDDNKDDNKGDDNNSGGGGGGAWTGTYSGEVTFYEIGSNACGKFDTEPDMICALSIPRAQSYPGFTGNNNKNPICGQHITLRWKGRSVTVKVTDTCEGCAWNDVDLSKAAFSQLTGGQMELGRIDGVEWSMN